MEEKVGEVVGGVLCLFMSLAVILAIVMLAFARPLAVLMQSPEEALAGIDEEFREIVRGSMFIDETRRDALCRFLARRVEMLESAAKSMQKSVFVDSAQFDVAEDIAYSGGQK